MTRASLFGFLAVVFGSLFAAKRDPVNPDPNGKNPIPAVNTVFIEDMTWMEVRDAMKGGKDTVIIATGGIEQNGPYLVTGKHNVVLKGTTEAIARKLGNALVAPIIAFVPEAGAASRMPAASARGSGACISSQSVGKPRDSPASPIISL